MTRWPELQEIIDRFTIAADAAVDRARRQVAEWRVEQMKIRYHQFSISTLEPGPGQILQTYKGVPIQALIDGTAEFPA
ncbi:hypothetical protein [Phaeobacter phage MD18]|nr:hypothetical protein [Phaeobacter phage MD18]